MLASMGPDQATNRMNTESASASEIAIDEVRPEPHGFTLFGYTADRTSYRLELIFDFPMDVRTRRVLGELLSQAVVRVSEQRTSLRAPPARRTRRPSARAR